MAKEKICSDLFRKQGLNSFLLRTRGKFQIILKLIVDMKLQLVIISISLVTVSGYILDFSSFFSNICASTSLELLPLPPGFPIRESFKGNNLLEGFF